MNSKEERDKIHTLISEKVEAHIKKVNEAALNLGLGSLNTSAESGRRQGYYSGYSEAMTEYRSIGERESREQVINELVGWMEEKSSPCWVKGPSADEAFTMCIHKAKSLLNQHGTVEKKYGEKLIDAIEKLERMGLWEEWKEENPSKVNALKKLINEKSNQQGEETCDAMGHFGGTKPEGICDKCNKKW